MPVHNADVAEIFEEIADLLEIDQASRFRVRAYRNAARVIRDLNQDIRKMVREGADLTALPGIGKDLAGKIKDIVESGKSETLEKLRSKVPPALSEMLTIPGLGPKRVHAIYEELGITTMEDLEQAARDARIRGLEGFGEKTEKRIAQALKSKKSRSRRFLLSTAADYAEPLVEFLSRIEGVDRVVVAGSYRRGKETVGDIDILVTAGKKSPVIEKFTGYDDVTEVLGSGETKASVILKGKLQVDLRVLGKESFGAALVYFTGSKAHNVALRQLGLDNGLKINEYGVFRGDKRVAGKTEESVYESVGLPMIPPELREDRGELEAAREGRLPDLVELKHLKGDLHSHTDETDGRNTLAEMAQAARDFGLQYLAITDHTQRLSVTRGLDSARLRKQMAAIDKLNQEQDDIVLLKGTECDILEDGTLDLPDDVLADLDVVVVSVHSHFDLSRERQTERIMKAMDNRYVHILGHPTGRLIGERAPYEVDIEKLVKHARKTGCFLELNAQPERLDLDDIYCRMARDAGVLVSINSDSHGVQHFGKLRFGVGQARRGWLEKADVLNTRPLKELKRLLSRRRKGG